MPPGSASATHLAVLLGAVALSGTLLLTRALTSHRDLPEAIGEARVPAPAPALPADVTPGHPREGRGGPIKVPRVRSGLDEALAG